AEGSGIPAPKKRRLKKGAIPSQCLPAEDSVRKLVDPDSRPVVQNKPSKKPGPRPRGPKPTDAKSQKDGVPQGKAPSNPTDGRSWHLQPGGVAHSERPTGAPRERRDAGCKKVRLVSEDAEPGRGILEQVDQLVNAIPGLKPGMLLALRLPQSRLRPVQKCLKDPPQVGRCWTSVKNAASFLFLHRQGDSPECWPAPQNVAVQASPESKDAAVQATLPDGKPATRDAGVQACRLQAHLAASTQALDADFSPEEHTDGKSLGALAAILS
ncbi:unnamed protein product, partial [Ixodes hexagonus]